LSSDIADGESPSLTPARPPSVSGCDECALLVTTRFFANYGDVLPDAPMDIIVEQLAASNAAGSILAVRPQDSLTSSTSTATRESRTSRQ
jgi:hypothetical protein